MKNKIEEIFKGRFSIYYDGVEVLKNLLATSMECQIIPPFSHLVYTFTAVSEVDEYNIFNDLASGVIGYSESYQISNGFIKCDAHIDSYEVVMNHTSVADMSGVSFVLPPPSREIIIHGHVEGSYSTGPNRFKKKEPEPIYSRFDILDL